MVDSIKITALQDIGANIAYTTLVPLVNMAGTPTTQKANLQNLGNLINVFLERMFDATIVYTAYSLS
jgi:hypothetical protein